MLHRIYWYVWFAGTALIVLSWLGAVTPAVGWTGFAVACAAALLSYLPQRRGRRRGPDWAVLSRAMVEAKDHGYELAMDHLSQGGTVFYDGIAFAVRPRGEVALAAVASLPAADLDEGQALRDAERVRADFEALARLAPDVASITGDRKVRVSLLSEFGANGIEICRVADDGVEWKAKAKGADRYTERTGNEG